MDNIQSSFKDKTLKTLGEFSNSRFIRAIMGAGYSIVAFSIIGSMFLILTVLPQVITAKGFVDIYTNTVGRFNSVYSIMYNATMGIIAIFFAGAFAYNYTDIYRKEEHLHLDPLNGVFLTLMALFITVPQLIWKGGHITLVNSLEKDNVVVSGYGVTGSGLTRIGATGIFTGLVVAWITVQIYRFCIKHNLRIKMPASVPSGVANSFSALIPGFVVALTIGIADIMLIVLGTDIFQVLYIPFSFVSNIADTWWGFLAILFFIHFLWWFGIHGGAIIPSFYSAIVLMNMADNVKGGFHVFAGDPINSFVSIGGCGSTLGVTIFITFMARSKQLRELGKLELVPAIFNIDEPLIFGLPIIYNVELLVPFICAPLVSGVVAYVAIATHIVPKIIVQQPWPTPVGLSGMLATASWQGFVLSIVCAIVAFLIWLPFIKHYDTIIYKKEQEACKE